MPSSNWLSLFVYPWSDRLYQALLTEEGEVDGNLPNLFSSYFRSSKVS